MTLCLPDVTLIAIDCAAHSLTFRAIEDTLRQLEPANAIIWSDRAEAVPSGAKWVRCEPLRSLREVAIVLWWYVPRLVTTTHFLLVQWDGWVLDAGRWSPEFLEYDYVGAPWWFNDGLNVGNGGFSLRSVRLGRYLAANRHVFPILGEPEDSLCRRYRPALERRGFRWAPDPLAARFAFERTTPLRQRLVSTVISTGRLCSVATLSGNAWPWPTIMYETSHCRRALMSLAVQSGLVCTFPNQDKQRPTAARPYPLSLVTGRV